MGARGEQTRPLWKEGRQAGQPGRRRDVERFGRETEREGGQCPAPGSRHASSGVARRERAAPPERSGRKPGTKPVASETRVLVFENNE